MGARPTGPVKARVETKPRGEPLAPEREREREAEPGEFPFSGGTFESEKTRKVSNWNVPTFVIPLRKVSKLVYVESLRKNAESLKLERSNFRSGNLKTGTGKASECLEIRCQKDPNFQKFYVESLRKNAESLKLERSNFRSGNLKTGTGKASECQEIRCRKDPNFQNFGTFQLSRGAFQQFCLALARRPPAGPAAGPAAAGSQAPALLGDGRQSTHTTCTGLRFVEKHASCGRSQSPRDFLEEVVPCSEKP